MTIRLFACLFGAALLSGCGANPAWDNTQATMDPHERAAAEMRAKQDAAPPIPATPPAKAPVAAAPAPAPATAAPKAQ